MPEIPVHLVVDAYRQGFFPMPDPETERFRWYYPDPRAVFPLDGLKLTRSWRRSIRNRGYRVSCDQAFADVVDGCASRSDTWINQEIKDVYGRMHEQGWAHSVEVWQEDQLVGGLYGVSLGAAFFAESKFSRQRDASKVALYYLVELMRKKGCELLEVQFMTDHLARLGAVEVAASEYAKMLESAVTKFVKWNDLQNELVALGFDEDLKEV